MRVIYLLLFFCCTTTILHAQGFITRWDLSNAGSGATQLTFGVGTTGSCNYSWESIPVGQTGSGTFSGNTLNITGLPAGAMIRLSIDTTNFRRIKINNGIDKKRLVDIEQWGSVMWTSMQNAFQGCCYLDCTATDIPDLSHVSNINFMFDSCVQFSGNASMANWNTSNITNMYGVFHNAYNFNQPIGNWNTSNVLDMALMFYHASSFNQPIGNWNTSNVLDMAGMFSLAYAFDQPVANWNTSNVVDMSAMFYHATHFNQYLGDWHFNMNVMLNYMLDSSGVDCSMYSAILHGWAVNNTTPMYIELGAANLKHLLYAQAERNFLVNAKGWIIDGDTMYNNCCTMQVDTIVQSGCNPFFFNGQLCNYTGIYYDTVMTVSGCDSLITLDLTVNRTTDTLNQSDCYTYFFNGQTLTGSGTYYDTLVNAVGCDSLIVLNLTINPVNTFVTQTGNFFSANATGATYQWLSCNPYQEIIGETNQTFTATANGNYAVVVTENGCTDTSACYTVIGIGINDVNLLAHIELYPNPAHDQLQLQSSTILQNAEITVWNMMGQTLLSDKNISGKNYVIDLTSLAAGNYYIQVRDMQRCFVGKVFKK